VIYEVRLSRIAERYLRRLSRPDQSRIIRRLEQIASDPSGPASRPLTNAAGFRSARVGDWRIVLRIDDEARVIEVADIGPRGQVYRRL
jgi:mRNA interferase RelE/StbE